MRRALITLVVALAVASASALSASAAGGAGEGAASVGDGTYAGGAKVVTRGAGAGFDFYGSGWGHGLGLSQWGAYGLAQDGWGHTKIVKHFYTGSIVESTAAPNRIRLGLTQSQTKIHLEALAGPVTLRISNHTTGTLVGTIPEGKTWTVREVGDKYRVLNAKGVKVGGRDWGGTARNLYATYVPDGGRLHSSEGGATYSHGFAEFNIYDCGGSSCLMRLILIIPPEQYLLGLGEVPSSWPMASLRAQAIAARSYAFSKIEIYGQHRMPCNCALLDYAADMAYVGYSKESGVDGGRWIRAVRDTDGKVATSHGTVIQAFFTASDGGMTEDKQNVWGGDPISYLKGVCDPGDFTGANPNRVWTESFTAAYVTSRLAAYTGDIGTVKSFSDYVRGVSGRIVTVRANGASGSDVITGAQLKAALGLNDDKVWINKNKNITGAIRTEYDDIMCAPGLPTGVQVSLTGGSKQRFETGVIFHNTGDVTVWLKGPIYDEYVGAGGVDGPLGLPASNVVDITGPGCADGCNRVTFDDGRIYWKSGVGANALWGRVLSEYLAAGGAGGSLGFPTSRVVVAGDGSASAGFENGSISCPPPGAGACTVS